MVVSFLVSRLGESNGIVKKEWGPCKSVVLGRCLWCLVTGMSLGWRWACPATESSGAEAL